MNIEKPNPYFCLENNIFKARQNQRRTFLFFVRSEKPLICQLSQRNRVSNTQISKWPLNYEPCISYISHDTRPSLNFLSHNFQKIDMSVFKCLYYLLSDIQSMRGLLFFSSEYILSNLFSTFTCTHSSKLLQIHIFLSSEITNFV